MYMTGFCVSGYRSGTRLPKKGDRVFVPALGNKAGIVDGEPRLLRGKWLYPVAFDPAVESPYYPEDALSRSAKPPNVKELMAQGSFAEADRFLLSLIYRSLEKPLSDNLYTFYASRTEFQVHQFKPVMKFLTTDKQRLLLADEVGLGKTIEAGIIITEQEARLGSLSRVLIVCPAMLVEKWQLELQKRFNQQFAILRRNDFDRFLDHFSKYGEGEKLKAICSLQMLRTRGVLNRLREVEPHFDIVVVDEAHYMRNPETLSSELGEVLSELADSMLFLSATPMQLGTPDLFNLLRLLLPEQFTDFSLFHSLIEPNEYINNAARLLQDPAKALEELRKVELTGHRDRFRKNPYYQEAVSILQRHKKLTRDEAIHAQKLLIDLNSLSYVFTRTKKRDVATEFPVRRARTVNVNFTPAEMEFCNALTRFVIDRFTSRTVSSQGVSFAVIMPQRQVASCIQAARDNLQKLVQDRILQPDQEAGVDVLTLGADLPEIWNLADNEANSLRRVLHAAKKIGDVDTKFDKFVEALEHLSEEDPKAKILVFAFFKRTLNYLYEKLQRTKFEGQVALIHGDIQPKERQKIIHNFRYKQDCKILLSSDVGGEGLDFEFCSVIFNYDLPWNPMRVEQRIGRLDRYGQRHDTILIYNFSMKGTIDDEIFSRLYSRINVFERYIGDLEAIIGDEISELTAEIFSAELSEAEKVIRIEKVADNIARRQKELEGFETECQRFIGQDAYFNREINRIRETKRFVSPDEVQLFLRTFLKLYFPKTTLLSPKSGRPRVYVLKADDEFRSFVWRWSEGDDNRKPTLARLEQDGGALVTFDSEEACRDEQLEFITIHHTIIKAIKRYFDRHPAEVSLTGQLALRGSRRFAGDYFFFVYLLEKAALKVDLQMVPVLLKASNGDVHILDDVSDWFRVHVAFAEPINGRKPAPYQPEVLDNALTRAEEYMDMIREDEEGSLKRMNDSLIANKIDSVRQTALLKVRRAEQTLDRLLSEGRTEDDSIVRLHRGRIRNLQTHAEEAIRELEARRAAAVSFRLMAGGQVVIGD